MLHQPSHHPVSSTSRRRSRTSLRDTLQAATASAFGVPLAELRLNRRGSAQVAFARQSAMYLAHVVCGLSYAEIGRAFRRDRTTAAHACRLVEERRDDPVLDSILEALAYAVLRQASPSDGAAV